VDASRLTNNLYDAYSEAGFEVKRPPGTELFFCVKSDSQNADLAPYVFMRVSPGGVLVFSTAEVAAVLSKYGCSSEDLAYALSIVGPEMWKSKITMEIKEGQIVAHTMIRLGFFSSLTSIYNETHDAMIDIRVAFSLVEQEIAFCLRYGRIFGLTGPDWTGK